MGGGGAEPPLVYATGCRNFVSIFSIEPNFCRDVEDIILTNLFFFVFGIVTFWREKNVANFAPKKLNNS